MATAKEILEILKECDKLESLVPLFTKLADDAGIDMSEGVGG